MGVYYAAVDHKAKEFMEPPKGFSIKYPGIFHPKNPFSNMVMMKNSEGCNFEVINDGYDSYYDYKEEYREVTEENFKRLIEMFPDCFELYSGT